MRVTFVVAAVDFGGGIRVIAQYAEGLRRKGHEVLVVSPPPYPVGRVAKLRDAYFPPKGIAPSSHFDNTEVQVKFLERYRAVRASDVPQADVIIATWWETAEWIASFPENRGAKVHFVQDYEIWNGDKARVDACLQLPIDKITISKWLENILVDQLDMARPTVILNGVEASLFSASSRKMPKEPTVGFVYAPNHRKGSDIAIRAISLAKKRIPDLRAVAFGHSQIDKAAYFPEYIDYYTAPPQYDLRKIYGSCTVWLFSSREEGFGLPVLEALACGTPVIATSAGAASEILKDGGGTILSTTNAQEMANEIIRTVEDKESEWQKLSVLGLKTAKKYSVQNSIDLFEKTLSSIIKKNRQACSTNPIAKI